MAPARRQKYYHRLLPVWLLYFYTLAVHGRGVGGRINKSSVGQCKPIFFVGGAKCGSTTLAMLLKYKEGTGHTDPAGPFDRSDVFSVLFLATFNFFPFLVLELELERVRVLMLVPVLVPVLVLVLVLVLARVLMLVPVLVLVLPMFLWLQQQ